jgi:hypothetical protein
MTGDDAVRADWLAALRATTAGWPAALRTEAGVPALYLLRHVQGSVLVEEDARHHRHE